MLKLIESSYNTRNKCGVLILNYRAIKLTNLLKKIGINDFFAIIEETDGSVDYSSNLHHVMSSVYKVTPRDYQIFEKLISNDLNADILITEVSTYLEEIILNNLNNLEKTIINYKVSNYIININKFESEISILFINIEKEQFEILKKEI